MHEVASFGPESSSIKTALTNGPQASIGNIERRGRSRFSSHATVRPHMAKKKKLLIHELNGFMIQRIAPNCYTEPLKHSAYRCKSNIA